MSDFNDVFRRYGEEFDFYKNLPLVVYNDRSEIKEYVEEEARSLIDEDYTYEEIESLDDEEWEDVWSGYVAYVEQNDFHNVLPAKKANNLIDDVYSFEEKTNIPVYIDRRRYGELQVCVDDEESLSKENIAKTKEFFNRLIDKYDLRDVEDIKPSR